MSYLVLARRWRPKQFSDLIGQDVVVRTLKNAMSGNSLAHAYLLTGIRGVGKTTIARLMAMAVNCADASGGEPCTKCDACMSIMKGSNLDVQEMDAASHTGVDDIREILDGVRYPPASLKYRVYIIDEAHMLSRPAFNALLKTLEEPPAHVLFILATTEVEKLPITVRSRCQRFDLRRLGSDEITAYLHSVMAAEKIDAEDAALHAIARAADGSVRDALSLAERVLAYAGDRVGIDDVQHALGLVGPEVTRSIANAVFEGDAAQSVERLRAALAAGHAPRTLLLSLSELIHRLSCIKLAESLLADEPDGHEREWLAAWAPRWQPQALDLRYQVLVNGLRDLALVDEQRGAEMILMRLGHLNAISAPAEGKSPDAGNVVPIPAAGRQPSEKVEPPAANPDRQAVAQVPDEPAPIAKPEPVVTDDAGRREDIETAAAEGDLPLHDEELAAGHHFMDWEQALHGYHEIKPGVTAMLEHVRLLEFGERVRLSLDRHQQNAITVADRMAFQEWIGREVFWEGTEGGEGESLQQSRLRQAESEKRRLWEQAQNDPHIRMMSEGLELRLTDVRAPGVELDGQLQE